MPRLRLRDVWRLDALPEVRGLCDPRPPPFVRLDAAQTDTILASISKRELAPETPLEQFFVMTKHATIQGYYTSEIGIHKELHYKGNSILQDFVGCLTVDGKDCPHCGQKAEA